MLLQEIPKKEDIISAEKRIHDYVHRTPVFTSTTLNEILGVNVYFKCENLQKVGAFKMRGASNAILSLTKAQLKKGVATHSSGNHAQAVALAAKLSKIPAYIVMPQNAPEVKVEAVRRYGAEVIYCDSTLNAREETLKDVVAKTGATFIHPYDNYDVIAGQATCAKEMIEDTDHLKAIYAPIGGGGLMAGTLLSSQYFGHKIPVIGAEPEGADDAYRSWKAGKIIPMEFPDTIADGLRTSLGERNFPIIQEHIEDIITVSDQEIIEAMRLIFNYLKLVVEPSGAVPFASMIKSKERYKGHKVGVILCGGNVDLKRLPF
ncbi:threonine ammonia-lyase [Marivirga arenosa]|uniref:Pyridoxal-phosphate dependent enzyme n=1 Tax=Marivirga arenosa TaxID=3059076 RepID=A0AA51N7H8_9BACT|nr:MULTISPECIES: pyridoxal-phosphate dependent enzyme [unclassified Marivirga]WMN07721.1 pyridoxal-phosphate dependent enzyme [Marivirga sp. ABR2-2]WNB18047.1 pyridoxal-phosphate dependent enzyme [Marivirga sp. BKB1-2]